MCVCVCVCERERERERGAERERERGGGGGRRERVRRGVFSLAFYSLTTAIILAVLQCLQASHSILTGRVVSLQHATCVSRTNPLRQCYVLPH